MGRVSHLTEHAVLAVDPGGTTGVAAGYVQTYPTLKETLADGLSRTKSIEVSGSWDDQAVELERLFNKFVFTANVESQIPLDRIHIVLEDFVLRMPARTTNLTSVWVAAGAVAIRRAGYADGAEDPVEIAWQQPSQAKGFATNERLKLWGLWKVGSAHERDAWRHFATFVNTLL